MSDDIVSRLRSESSVFQHFTLATEAADEVERLRADLIMCATHNKEAVAAEREACAQRCNSIAFLYDEGSEGAKAAFDCCAAIRARGTP